MKILVAGGTGFLGASTCHLLQARGYKVGAIGRRLEAGKELEAAGITFHPLDLHNSQMLDACVSEYDVVVNCAGMSSHWGRFDEFYQANVLTTQNIVDACFKHDIKKLIHISSASVYDGLKERQATKETDPIPKRPINNYIASKRLAEEIIKNADKMGLATITLRPQMILDRKESVLLPRLVKLSAKKLMPTFKRDDVLIDFSYVENVAEAIHLAIEADEMYNGAKYNISNGEAISLYATLKSAFEKIDEPVSTLRLPYYLTLLSSFVVKQFYSIFLPDKPPLICPYSVSIFSKSRTVDISAAQTDLGYQPKTNNAEGFEQWLAWSRESS